MGHERSRVFTALSSVLGVLLALLLAEGAVRAYWWSTARRALAKMAEMSAPEHIDTGPGVLGAGVRNSVFPDIVYELRPNLRGVYDGKQFATDRFGFREDRPIDIEKPAGVLRILGIGDSWMWGSGVNNGETYLDVLDASLSQEGFAIQTINTAVWGYNAVQQIATLERKGVQFSPDVVVVGLCGNDREYPSFLRETSYLSASGSALWKLLRGALPRSVRAGQPEADRAGELMPFSDFRDAYEELASSSRRHGFQVVIFSECLREPLSVAECLLGSAEEWQQFIDDARGRWGFRLCGWDAHPLPSNPRPWGHATAAGHQILARRLEECVKPLLGSRRKP